MPGYLRPPISPSYYDVYGNAVVKKTICLWKIYIINLDLILIKFCKNIWLDVKDKFLPHLMFRVRPLLRVFYTLVLLAAGFRLSWLNMLLPTKSLLFSVFKQSRSKAVTCFECL